MLAFWTFMFLAAIIFDRAHRMKIDTIVIKHQYRLYRLRDALRESAADGVVDPKNWVFQYLDSSITKTVSVLGHLSFWQIVATIPTAEEIERYERAHAHLKRELEKPSNAALRACHRRYHAAVHRYVYDRHLSLRIMFINFLAANIGVEFLKSCVLSFKRFFEQRTALQTESPDMLQELAA